MKLFKKYKSYQECKLCHAHVNQSATKRHLELIHARELFKLRGKYLTNVKKVVKKLKKEYGYHLNTRSGMEKLQDCDLVTYPTPDFRLGENFICNFPGFSKSVQTR